jgi:MFS family permease
MDYLKNFKINRIIKYLILSDLVFYTGWGLISPIFAIFVVEKIQGGNAFVAGLASAVYLILMSLLRVPFGMFLDTRPGERDDYWFLTVGLFVAALTSFGFIFAKFPWHVYLLQIIRAITMAMTLAAWPAIFTRHIDKGKESTEWGLDATSVGLGAGISGAIGGWAVIKFGFNPVFIVVGIVGLIGAGLLLFLKEDIKGVFDHGLRFSLKEIFQKEEKR